MNVQWTFRNCESSKDQARSYLEKKLPQLKRRLSRFRDERCRIDLTLYSHPNRELWELRAVLTLPTGRLIASSEKSDITYVIDEVVRELAKQIRRHKARVRREHIVRRRRRSSRDFATHAPFLEREVTQERRQDFFEILSPLLDGIRDHAAFELRLLELEEEVPTGEIDVEELVDEVLLLAYDRFKLRPPDTLMEAWLMGLLHERLNAMVDREPPLSLASESNVAVRDEEEGGSLDFEDVKYWISHVFDEEHSAGLEELVPDEEVAATFQQMEAIEEQRCLKEFVDQLPKRQRQALMLCDASGFEIAEIATVLQIPEPQVRRLIEQARSTLHGNLAGYAVLPSN